MPRYQHDCSVCVPLGELEHADLYFCRQGGSPTVIARYSDAGRDYNSGLALASMNKYLARAVGLATERGLLKN